MTKGNCEIYTGSYSGTGSTSHSLHFPKLPRLLFIGHHASTLTPYYGIVGDGNGLYTHKGSYVMSVSGTGVTLNGAYVDPNYFNSSGNTYDYIALAPHQ